MEIMKRTSENKRSKFRRKAKYLLLLLLLGLNFKFTWSYISRLQKEINELHGQLNSSTATVTDQAHQISTLQTKIHILAKGDPSRVIHNTSTIVHKVAESVPDVSPSIHLLDPSTIIVAGGTAVSFVLHSMTKVWELVH